jgi:hypothetical protein
MALLEAGLIEVRLEASGSGCLGVRAGAASVLNTSGRPPTSRDGVLDYLTARLPWFGGLVFFRRTHDSRKGGSFWEPGVLQPRVRPEVYVRNHESASVSLAPLGAVGCLRMALRTRWLSIAARAFLHRQRP